MKAGDRLMTTACDAALTLKDEGASEGGKLPSFSMVAYTGGAIRQRFSSAPIIVDLAGMEIPTRPVPIRLDHDSGQGVGHTTKVWVEQGSTPTLMAEGVVSRATESARDVVESGKNGFPWQSSIGADILVVEEVKAGASAEANGQTWNGPALIVRKSKLGEISWVDLGADDNTTGRVAARDDDSTNGGPNMGGEQNNGSGASNQNNAQGDNQNQNQNQKPPLKMSGDASEHIERTREQSRVEAERRAGILQTMDRVTASRPDLAEQVCERADLAITAGMDSETFALECMQFTRDIPNVGTPRRDRAPDGKQIEAALILASGMMSDDELVKEYGDQTVNAASDRFGTSFGLSDALMLAARSRGWDGLSLKSDADMERALRLTFDPNMPQHIQAASTISLPTIFSNVANKAVAQGFDAVEQSWRKTTAVGSVRDFKQQTLVNYGGDFVMKKVGKNGELEHAVPSEESYTNQAHTYGRMLGLSRQDIYNDDLGLLMQSARKHGRGGVLALISAYYTELQDNASFFTTGNGSRITGGGSALGVAALTAAEVAFMSQTDPDGNPLGIAPKILLVPPALKSTAKQLVESTEIRNTTADTVFGTSNPHQGSYEVVVSQYLTSATAWALLADPRDLAVMHTVFLNGRQRPTVEQAQANFSTLGIQMRGFFDFGVSKHEYRAGVWNNGA